MPKKTKNILKFYLDALRRSVVKYNTDANVAQG